MSRWLLLSSCVLVLAAVAHLQSVRSPAAKALGGACVSDRDCQVGLECEFEPGVMEGQCTATCNDTAACQDRFGAQSMCLAADLCAQTCTANDDCPSGSACNAYGWCEG